MSDRSGRIGRIGGGLLCLVMALSVLLMLSWELSKVWSFVNMGDIWSMLALSDEPGAEFREVAREDFPDPPRPSVGDSLLAIEGVPATRDNYFDFFSPTTEPGARFEIDYLSMETGEVLSTMVVASSIPTPVAAQVLLLTLLRVLIVLSLVGIAAWGLVNRGGSVTVKLLAVFCLGIAMEMTVSVSLSEAYAVFSMPGFLAEHLPGLSLLAPPAWLLLTLSFPRPNPFYERHRTAVRLGLLAVVAALGVYSVVGPDKPDGIATIPYVVSVVLFALGVAILIRSNRRAEVPLERRQTRLVLFGVIPSIGSRLVFLGLIVVAAQVIQRLGFVERMLVFNATFLLFLPLPVMLALAIRRYRLLELEARLKRGTRFVVVNILLIAVMLGIVFGFAQLLLEGLKIRSRTPTLVVGLALALGFVPGQRRIRRFLDRRFYPEKNRLRKLLGEFLERSSVYTDAREFWTELDEQLAVGLDTGSVNPVIPARDGRTFLSVEGEETPFSPEDDVVTRLAERGQPLLTDEIMASGKVDLSEAQRDWLTERESALLLPLRTKSGLVGFVSLGRKTTGEDYGTVELELLHSLGVQMAVVVENLSLLEERMEKRKLDQQMELARSIQKGLLPTDLDSTPGIRVEALVRFCLEVAGDYYDVFSLRSGKKVLAVGDVAGKGMGPALLMANLQASLRTTQEVGLSPSESMTRMNRLIHDNTPSDMFITLFLAVYDPGGGVLRYVNAGHNPPLLLKGSGGVERLDRGGLLLGVDPDTGYEEGWLALRPGDTLLMFTDGVTEAMDDSGEEFGEERLQRVASELADGDPAEMLCGVEREVVRHSGSSEFADDFTLLVLKRL